MISHCYYLSFVFSDLMVIYTQVLFCSYVLSKFKSLENLSLWFRRHKSMLYLCSIFFHVICWPHILRTIVLGQFRFLIHAIVDTVHFLSDGKLVFVSD